MYCNTYDHDYIIAPPVVSRGRSSVRRAHVVRPRVAPLHIPSSRAAAHAIVSHSMDTGTIIVIIIASTLVYAITTPYG